jgi:hypothetical protein
MPKKTPSKPVAKAPVKKPAVKKPVAKAPAVKAPAAKAPATKAPVASKSVTKITTVIAKVDVGWGNSLYLRGAGSGLSWDVGERMECLNNDEWVWTAPAGSGPITFKFLRNDLHWDLGPNQVVRAGATSVSSPVFPPWETLAK